MLYSLKSTPKSPTMTTKTLNKKLIPFQREKDIFLSVDLHNQINYKVNKLGKWTLRIITSGLGIFETYQLSSGIYFWGWEGIEFFDLIGLVIATVPFILYPTFLVKPRKIWPFRFVSFEEEEFVFNLKRKTISIRYDQIKRFQISTHGVSSSRIEFHLKDNSTLTAPWFSTNANEKQLEIRLAINDELNRRINLSHHQSLSSSKD